MQSDLGNDFFAIAIDGPSGVGKSSLAKELAKEFSYIYVDTGAMYRAVALYCLRLNIPMDDAEAVAASLSGLSISLRFADGAQRVFLGEEDVTGLLRSPEVAENSSKAAAVPEVRAKLVEIQQEIAHNSNVVMDGRDICTVVLPWAQVKIYLDADLHERTMRRLSELTAISAGYDDVRHDLEARDYRDTHRQDSPLIRCKEATYLDTNGLSFNQVKEKVMDLARKAVR